MRFRRTRLILWACIAQFPRLSMDLRATELLSWLDRLRGDIERVERYPFVAKEFLVQHIGDFKKSFKENFCYF